MISPIYREQVDLLLLVLPHVAKEEIFALKGGTAINLFVRNMPRLSVDIDLTYLPFDNRNTALENIFKALGRIKGSLENTLPGITVRINPQSDGHEAKLFCQLKGTLIKVEVNTTMRGHIHSPRLMQLTDAVQNEFGKFASINIVSHAELFGGKICAALDRQHPRDLFDVYHLFKNEGFTEEIRLGFLVSLLSHNRPIHEMIRPNFLDQEEVFEKQFSGMIFSSFSYDDYESTRKQLVQEIHRHLTDDDKRFLLSFKKGEPEWNLFPIEELPSMPAVKWKLMNIQKLSKGNLDKHAEQIDELKEALSD
ncbi:MAG: nucleotidyl transferase AbiEii/AbiGii toxin family protein [Nitrospinae bacterium]|jgi:predicted nucleotidyltransferase component of viral defense system|nr:nucleotidyl transferase AbiEii/AbiGii toxin family protein [Nitrospinota bacterium]MDA1110177.1 nucleotidyl transferase AbiEii/AbiGii toxin family protein [Nitrospinota bacterium]